MSEPSYSQTTAVPSDGPENLLARIANNTATAGASGGLTDTQLRAAPVPVSGIVTAGQATVTPTFIAVGASASGTIPSGAKGWTITFLTGTGTFGGVAISAGFSDSDPDILAAAITYTTAAASSAYVRYNS